jgi:hypothetical protein
LSTSKTTKLSEIPCSSCDQIRYQLKRKQSKLIPSFTLNLCNDCITKKFEPRWIIIMAGRQFGAGYVKDYLEPKRYVGEEILLRETT